jgi:hypothetical protein
MSQTVCIILQKYQTWRLRSIISYFRKESWAFRKMLVANIGSPKTVRAYRTIALVNVDYSTLAAVTVNIMRQYLMRMKYPCGKQLSYTRWQPLRTLLHAKVTRKVRTISPPNFNLQSVKFSRIFLLYSKPLYRYFREEIRRSCAV